MAPWDTCTENLERTDRDGSKIDLSGMLLDWAGIRSDYERIQAEMAAVKVYLADKPQSAIHSAD